MNVHLLLFDQFETLDAFGPVEVLECLDGYELNMISREGGAVTSAQGVRVDTVPLNGVGTGEILLIPGGPGTRRLVETPAFIESLRALAEASTWCLTVCTGSALLAMTSLLNGRRATSNKMAFDWVRSINPLVRWEGSARWIRDGKFYTSSGVSAGMDMALGFVADREGNDAAEQMAREIEYLWNRDPRRDPFAVR